MTKECTLSLSHRFVPDVTTKMFVLMCLLCFKFAHINSDIQ